MAVITVATLAYAFYASRRPAETAFPGGVMIVGAGVVVAAFAAWMRSSGVTEVIETIWDAICAIGVAVAAIMSAIWHGFLSLIGWD